MIYADGYTTRALPQLKFFDVLGGRSTLLTQADNFRAQ